jgi:hypothetical protein
MKQAFTLGHFLREFFTDGLAQLVRFLQVEAGDGLG